MQNSEPRRNDRSGRRPSKWQATELLQWALSCHDKNAAVDLGRIVYLGEGLSRIAFAANIEIRPDRNGLNGDYVALLATPQADQQVGQRFLAEARVLAHLQTLACPFRIPRVLGVRVDGGAVGMVQSYVQGIGLDLRHGRQPGVMPWEVVGAMAAAVHAASPPENLGGYPTWRAHAEAFIADTLPVDPPEPELRAARDWALSLLPAAEPSVLLHGDLLGQNILLSLDELPGLIDWEYAQRGDPAYELAVVTRGVRRPFQTEGGRGRLIDAYRRAGGAAVSEHQIRFYELCLLAGMYQQARPSRTLDGTADNILLQLGNFLRRLGA